MSRDQELIDAAITALVDPPPPRGEFAMRPEARAAMLAALTPEQRAEVDAAVARTKARTGRA